MKDKKTFGIFIKTKRIEKNLSQKDLAEMLFVTESAVSKWERGITYPDITLTTSICKALDITEHELFECSNDNEYRNIKKDALKYNRIKNTIFWTINICYLIAIITCFIVNLAVSHTLSWFFIVLASIICAYTFFPTIIWIFNTHKLITYVISTFIGLFLLFLTCSIFTNSYWFMIPTSGVALIYFIQYFPALFKMQKNHLNIKTYEKISKYFSLFYTFGILISILLLLFSIYIHVPYNIILGIIITTSFFSIPILTGIFACFNNSVRFIKPTLLITISLVLLSILFLTISSLHTLSKNTTREIEFTTNFDNIIIDTSNFDINIILSDHNVTKIVSKENPKNYIDYTIIDNVLKINQNDETKFYNNFFSFTNYRIDLYITKTLYNSLNITSCTGDINVPNDVTFNNVDINNSTGDLYFSANVINETRISVSTGDVTFKNSFLKNICTIKLSTGDITFTNVLASSLSIKSSSGDIDFKNVQLSNDLSILSSTGDFKFVDFDAENINVTTSTGSIKGTLLSEKVFICISKTGKVVVPSTKNGGICKINTNTGNIIISYK